MKKYIVYKIFFIVVGVIVLFSILLFVTSKRFNFDDGYAPGNYYHISINKPTKIVYGYIDEIGSCEDCSNSKKRCVGKVTNDQYEKILKIWNSKNATELDVVFYLICEKGNTEKSINEILDSMLKDIN